MGTSSSISQEIFPSCVNYESTAIRDLKRKDQESSDECCKMSDIDNVNSPSSQYAWPNGVIPYAIDESLIYHPMLISSINEAINQFHIETPIKFIPYRQNEDMQDFILFTFHPFITDSAIGRQGDKQEIRLSPEARKGNVMHEIMHALGFHHEHSRIDRDNFISVNMQKVKPEERENYTTIGCPLGRYDTESIMHYPIDGMIIRACCAFFRKIGQRERFSAGDIKAIKYLYSGPCCTYDVYEEESFIQRYYECITCWGAGSVYGVCEYCKNDCHIDHETILHDISENSKNFVCDCGRNRHIVNGCTRLIRKQKRVNQMFYICYDCFDVEEYERRKNSTPVVCKPCFMKCHEGHRYKEFGLTDGYCDCGKSYCKIICKVI